MSKSIKGFEHVKIPISEYHYLAVSTFKSQQVAEWLSAQKSNFADITALRLLYSSALPQGNPEGE